MSPPIMTALLLTLGLGTTVTFASSHWLLAWMGLEINTLAIIPLITHTHHPRSVEAATKYFLTQATAAATMLFASITNAWLTGQWNISLMTHSIPTTMVILALSLKIGLAPLHIWLPEVLQGLDLTTGLILSTWQKLAPLTLLIQPPLSNHNMLTLMALTSALVGGWGGLNQTQLRKILAYSSIAHLGWMVMIIQFAPELTILALATYLIMTSAAFLTLKLCNATSVNTLATSWSNLPLLTAMFPLVLLSLGGLPPLTGFIPKWLILQELTKQALPIPATLMALSALLSLYFYLRLSYTMTLTMSPNTLTHMAPWRLTPHLTLTPLPPFITAAMTLLPISPALLAMITS
uniref:NADH-ubiquinone oxidoreductase chain 2 n=1 Tax=Trimma okinawae TaxID=498271 RepID=A0A5K7TNV2_9GOBI|nr:NADH dehydrogenase subunit 2 [Trimma okinawae]